MNTFPVTSSILSATHVGLFLQQKYGLSDNAECRLIRAGINHTYKISDNGDNFIFRIYSLDWRSSVEIDEEIRLLNTLKNHNIAISYPLLDKIGHYIQILNAPEGDRYGVLFSFAKGEKIHSFSEEIHYKIGVLMAQLHNITHNMTLNRVTYNAQIMLIDSMKQLQNFLSDDCAEMDFMKSTQSYLINEFNRLETIPLRRGAVHLDIWFDNLNIQSSGEVTIFDFDFCGNGWLCLDVAYYILQVYGTEKDENICKVKYESFLNGYESITSLTEVEKQILPMLGVSLYHFYLGIQCQRYTNWSNTFLSEDYLKRFINGLVKRYFNIHQLSS